MSCTVMEKIKCKNCWESFKRLWFYHLADTYTLQPCKECRKKYWKNRYKKWLGFYDKNKILDNNKK